MGSESGRRSRISTGVFRQGRRVRTFAFLRFHKFQPGSIFYIRARHLGCTGMFLQVRTAPPGFIYTCGALSRFATCTFSIHFSRELCYHVRSRFVRGSRIDYEQSSMNMCSRQMEKHWPTYSYSLFSTVPVNVIVFFAVVNNSSRALRFKHSIKIITMEFSCYNRWKGWV